MTTLPKAMIVLLLALLAATASADIAGTVVDARTGDPIKKFSIILRPGASGERSPWQQYTLKQFTTGQFSIPHPRGWAPTQVRIWADGYRPTVTTVKLEDGPREIGLEPDAGIKGTVLLPDGAPAVGASVAIGSATTMPQVDHFGIRLGSSAKAIGSMIVLTDKDGAFTLPPEVDPARVIVFHDSGWAEIDLKDAGKPIRLQQWAIVQGQLLLGPGTGGDWNLVITHTGPVNADISCISYWTQLKTDAMGRFGPVKVAPTRVRITPFVKFETSTFPVMSVGTWLDLKPGQTESITLGGEGRPVIGRLVSSDGAAVDWSTRQFRIQINSPHIGFPGDEEMWKAQGTFVKAAEAAKYYHTITPAADGRFRIDRLPQGEYRVYDLNIVDLRNGFEIKPMDQGRMDEPLDLGDLQVVERKK